MITIAFMNWLIGIFNGFMLWITSPIHDLLINISTAISGFSIPVILWDTFALCVLFLPVGTIATLLVITLALVSIQILLAFAHFIFHIGNII